MSPSEPPSAPSTDRPARAPRWELTLLGGLRLADGACTHTRLPSRAITALLARLALWPQRAHAREELVELLWPGVDLATGRNRLRQALSTLRSLLEPPATVAAPVLQADRHALRLVAGSLRCDVQAFEQHVRAGDAAAAIACYGGELLPGYYDDWIDDERSRLAALRDRLDAVHTPSPAAGSFSAVAAMPAGARPPLPAPPAASLPGASLPRWLPHYMTRLFGIDAQAARLRAAVHRHRLVTLLGPGGSGKTRLAVELVHGVAAAAAAGTDTGAPPRTPATFEAAHFVSLIGCRDRAALLDALAVAFDLPSSARQDEASILDGIASRLADHARLLVLDNFEQLVDDANGIVAVLAERLPRLHLLVTSRRALGLDGERELAIEPLPLPAPATSATAPLAELAANPAVALFVDRAQAVRSDFHLGPRNAAVLAALVRALDGMPLAIELAAARVRSVAPADMLARLTRPPAATGATPRLDLLARQAPRGGLDPRHASMHATIDWSWRLLGAAPARLLGGLTCLPAGATADAAVAIWDGPEDARDLLDGLVAHSLLRFEPGDVAAPEPADRPEAGPPTGPAPVGAGRFLLTEPIREFAAARLTPPDAAHWAGRLRRWAVGWAGAAPLGPPIAALRAELPNLCAALQTAATDAASPAAAASDGVQLLLALQRRFEAVDLPAGALQHALDAVERCADRLRQGQGLAAIAPLLFAAGRSEAALDCARRAVEALAQADAAVQAGALLALAKVQWRMTRSAPAIAPLLDRLDALLAANGPAPRRDARTLLLHADVLALRARLSIAAADFDQARRVHAEALRLYEATGDPRAVNDSRYLMASTEQSAGRHAAALALLDPVADGARAMHDWRRLAQAHNVRGNALSGLRRWDEAVSAFRTSIDLAWRCMSPYEVAFGLWNLARALAHRRQPDAALAVAAFTAGFWASSFGVLDPADRRYLARVRRLCAVQLDATACARAWRHGEGLSLAEAVAFALTRSDAGPAERQPRGTPPVDRALRPGAG